MVGKFLDSTSKLYILQGEGVSSSQYLKLFSARVDQLLQAIYTVYKVIEGKLIVRPHNILVCGPDTNEIQIELMFKRAKIFMDIYMLIGINNLTFKLHEVSLHFNVL